MIMAAWRVIDFEGSELARIKCNRMEGNRGIRLR
jgi:hypothetical protein